MSILPLLSEWTDLIWDFWDGREVADSQPRSSPQASCGSSGDRGAAGKESFWKSSQYEPGEVEWLCLLYCLMKLFLPECLSLQTASCHYDPRSKLSPHSVKQIRLHTSPSFVQSIYKPWSMEYGMWRETLLALNRMRLCLGDLSPELALTWSLCPPLPGTRLNIIHHKYSGRCK